MTPKLPPSRSLKEALRGEDRKKALRSARDRALNRLRAEYDRRYQELMDEEVAAAGLEPRVARAPQYKPRTEANQQRYGTEDQ